MYDTEYASVKVCDSRLEVVYKLQAEFMIDYETKTVGLTELLCDKKSFHVLTSRSGFSYYRRPPCCGPLR